MKKKTKYLIASLLLAAFALMGAVCASAEEGYEQVEYPTDDAEEVNFFEKVYSEVSEYASEILCALTFTGSVFLAFAYKKGLLPLVEKSLITIGNAVTKIKENTKESTEISSQLGVNIDGRLSETQELISKLAERIGSLEETLGRGLENENEARLEGKQLRLVVDAQIDMLYDIFMSSALPQYQKDAVGERIAKMKGAIRENAGTK